MTLVTIDSATSNLAVAIVRVEGAVIAPSGDDLRAYCDDVARKAVEASSDDRRAAVRALLRLGGFKPSGRSKPAQEYLLRTATESGALPSIWNVVDLINAVSLESGLPISLISLDRVPSPFVLRYGAPGERFVFNSAGQEIDVGGLICLCSVGGAASRPVGTPVKDSLEAKVIETDRNLLACVYMPADAVDAAEANRWGAKLADGFMRWCGAAKCECSVAG